MASRRELKKKIKKETNDIIEDAFIESINGDDKEGTKMDGIIDDIIDDRHELLHKISSYPKKANRTKVKEHFNALKQDLSAKVKDYSKKIGRIS